MNGHGEANVALLSLVPPHDEERVEEQQVKKKWRRRLRRKTVIKMSKEKTLGMCMVCFGGSTTQVIHDGTAENPKRNDGCKFTMCWDCWYKSISAQAAEPGEKEITPKCPGCRGSLCYRVTFGKSNEPEVAYLRSFEAINDDTVLKMAAENRMQALRKSDGRGQFEYKCLPTNRVEEFFAQKQGRGEQWSLFRNIIPTVENIIPIESKKRKAKELQEMSKKEKTLEEARKKRLETRNWLELWKDNRQIFSRQGLWRSYVREALLATPEGKTMEKKRVPMFEDRKRKKKRYKIMD